MHARSLVLQHVGAQPVQHGPDPRPLLDVHLRPELCDGHPSMHSCWLPAYGSNGECSRVDAARCEPLAVLWEAGIASLSGRALLNQAVQRLASRMAALGLRPDAAIGGGKPGQQCCNRSSAWARAGAYEAPRCWSSMHVHLKRLKQNSRAVAAITVEGLWLAHDPLIAIKCACLANTRSSRSRHDSN